MGWREVNVGEGSDGRSLRGVEAWAPLAAVGIDCILCDCGGCNAATERKRSMSLGAEVHASHSITGGAGSGQDGGDVVH